MGVLEEYGEDPDQGGGESAGVRVFLQIRRTVSVTLWCGDVGGYPCMGQVLGGFQYQVVRKLTGRLPWQRLDGIWEYTSAEAAREEAGFEIMETYIWKSQNRVAQYISTRPILDLCEAAERKRGGMGRAAVVGIGRN